MPTMMSRRILGLAARVALGAMLFVQGALALAGCDWGSRAAARAVAMSAGEAGCHEEPARNANLCIGHCLDTDQSAGAAPLPNALPGAAVALVIDVLDGPSVRETELRHAPRRTHAPPPRILFQSFQI